MASMTLVELQELIHDMTKDSAMDGSIQMCLLVGMTADGKYQIVQVDSAGKVVTV
jgi:hypothetical protein